MRRAALGIVLTIVAAAPALADNPRPLLYGAYHHIESARGDDGPLAAAAICGRSCESDELGEALLSASIATGDLIAMRDTGAYTYSMASNYNRFARPPVVAVDSGNAALWVRRERQSELTNLDA